MNNIILPDICRKYQMSFFEFRQWCLDTFSDQITSRQDIDGINTQGVESI